MHLSPYGTGILLKNVLLEIVIFGELSNNFHTGILYELNFPLGSYCMQH